MFEILYITSLLLFAYRVKIARSRREIILLLAFIAAGLGAVLYGGASFPVILAGTILFNGLASTYHSRENYAYLLLAVIFVASLYTYYAMVELSMLLGLASAAYFFTKPNVGGDPKTEIRRDVVQIFLGLVLICAFALYPGIYANMFLIVSILLASFVGNFAITNKRNAVSKFIYTLERKSAVLGQGGLWLAIGALTAAAFLGGSNLQVIVVLAAIFIGDSVATVVGTAYRWPLPYNKKKSAAGSIAYFASSTMVSFPFVGAIGAFTSLVAAIFEGLAKHIDDNFETALVLTVLIRVLSFWGLI